MTADTDLSIEENVKVKEVLPFLHSLGFQSDELHFEKSFSFKAGKFTIKTDTEAQCRTLAPRLDILVTRDGKNLFVIEVKSDAVSITEEDIAQATSYAKLVHPPAPFAIVVNGPEWRLFNSLTREEIKKDSFKIKDHYEVTISEEARYEALKNFIGFSRANATTFCRQQVLEHMRPLRGSSMQLFKKYIPELHIPRDEFVETCYKFLQSDRQFLAIYGDSGIGKTCSLCDFALQLLENGDPVLFFRAREILDRIPRSIADDFNWTFPSEQSEIQTIKRIANVFGDTPVTICIDALDEWPMGNRVDVLGDFVRHAANFKIKLIVTCTTQVWPSFLSRRGIPTHTSEVAFHAENDEMGFHLRPMTDEQYFQAIDKYRDIYGFAGLVEDRVLREGQRNPFLLRVFFEAAQKHHLKHLTFSRIVLFDAYYDHTLEKLDDRETAAATLCEVARCLLENNLDYVGLDVTRKSLGLGINEKLLPALFDYSVLDLTHGIGGDAISFFFPFFRDYLVAYHVLKLQKLSLDEYRGVIDRYSGNQIFGQALKLFYPMAENDKQDVIDHQLRTNAREYLCTYCEIIGSLFPNLKEAFSPHTNGKVGFIAEFSVQDRTLGMYGFRALSEGDQDEVKFVPVDKAQTSQSNLAYLNGADSLHWIGSANGFKEGINITREVLFNEIEPQLREIVKTGSLNETQNFQLLSEKLTATVVKYQGSHHKIANPYMIAARLPITFKDIERARRYEKASRVYEDELIAEKRRSGEIKETRLGSIVSFSYRPTDEDKKAVHDRAVWAAENNIEVESDVIRRDQDMADRAIAEITRRLRESGSDEIREIILPVEGFNPRGHVRYSHDELAPIIGRFHTLFLNEYKLLIETNFGQMSGEFTPYSKMPLRCFAVLMPDSVDDSYRMRVYYTRKDTGDNEVIVAKEDQIEFTDRPMALSYAGRTYSCEWVQSTDLSHFTNAPHDYISYSVDHRLVPLRNRVYNEIERDLNKIIKRIKRQCGFVGE